MALIGAAGWRLARAVGGAVGLGAIGGVASAYARSVYDTLAGLGGNLDGSDIDPSDVDAGGHCADGDCDCGPCSILSVSGDLGGVGGYGDILGGFVEEAIQTRLQKRTQACKDRFSRDMSRELKRTAGWGQNASRPHVMAKIDDAYRKCVRAAQAEARKEMAEHTRSTTEQALRAAEEVSSAKIAAAEAAARQAMDLASKAQKSGKRFLSKGLSRAASTLQQAAKATQQAIAPESVPTPVAAPTESSIAEALRLLVAAKELFTPSNLSSTQSATQSPAQAERSAKDAAIVVLSADDLYGPQEDGADVLDMLEAGYGEELARAGVRAF